MLGSSLLSPLTLTLLPSSALVLAAGLFACGGDQPSAPDATTQGADAGAADAPNQPCRAEDATTYYADFDGDGYGSPDLTAVDCDAPENFVENMLDCDDADSRSNPDGIELCDGLDNDCDAATVEVCANSCSPQDRGEGRIYLFCAQTRSFSVAKTACQAEGMHLLQIEDQDEQTWMSAQRSTAFGGLPRVWTGGNDGTAEGVWVWHDDQNFWNGGAGGAVADGQFALWRGGEPNNGDGGEDCATIDNDLPGRWDDRSCVDSYRFVCERDPDLLTE